MPQNFANFYLLLVKKSKYLSTIVKQSTPSQQILAREEIKCAQ